MLAKLSVSSSIIYPPSNTTVKSESPSITYHYNDTIIAEYDFNVQKVYINLACYIDLATAQAGGNKTKSAGFSSKYTFQHYEVPQSSLMVRIAYLSYTTNHTIPLNFDTKSNNGTTFHPPNINICQLSLANWTTNAVSNIGTSPHPNGTVLDDSVFFSVANATGAATTWALGATGTSLIPSSSPTLASFSSQSVGKGSVVSTTLGPTGATETVTAKTTSVASGEKMMAGVGSVILGGLAVLVL